jgi:hypothetical protein
MGFDQPECGDLAGPAPKMVEYEHTGGKKKKTFDRRAVGYAQFGGAEKARPARNRTAKSKHKHHFPPRRASASNSRCLVLYLV